MSYASEVLCDLAALREILILFRVFAMLTLNKLREISRRDVLLSMARIPNSERLLVASSEGKVYELDASRTDGPVVDHANHGRYVHAVRSQGNIAVSGGYDNKLIWWDLEKKEVIRTVDAHTRPVRQLAISPDGTKLASVGDDMVCRLWNLQTGQKIHELKGHAERTPTHFISMLYAVTFSPDGRHLATGDRVGHIVVWDVQTGREVATMEAPTLYTWDGTQRIRSIGGIRALAFSPDNTQLAVGGVGQIGNVDALQGPSRVEIFNWQRREKLLDFTGAQGIINKLIYHPRSKWLCAIGGGASGIVMLYDPAEKKKVYEGNLPMHTHDGAFDEEFGKLYVAGHNKAAVFEVKE